MRVVIQRVSRASVTIKNKIRSEIGPGLLDSGGDGGRRIDGAVEQLGAILFESREGDLVVVEEARLEVAADDTVIGNVEHHAA